MSPTTRRWHEASAASIAASQGCSREGFRGRWTQAAAEIGSSGVAPARGGREAGREEAWRGQTVCWHAQGGIAAGVEQTRAHGGRVIYGLVGMREGAGGAGRRELGAFVRHGACPVLPQVVCVFTANSHVNHGHAWMRLGTGSGIRIVDVRD